MSPSMLVEVQLAPWVCRHPKRQTLPGARYLVSKSQRKWQDGHSDMKSVVRIAFDIRTVPSEEPKAKSGMFRWLIA
jgi:hypothetical protein